MTVSKKIETILSKTEANNPVIGILGVGSMDTIVDIIKLLPFSSPVAYEPLSPLYGSLRRQLTIKVFSVIDSQLTALFASKMLKQLLQAHHSHPLQPIEGCQRLKLRQGQLSIDFHLGDYEQQLRQIPLRSSNSTSDTTLVQHWICSADIDPGSINENVFWQMAKLSTDNCECFVSCKLTAATQRQLQTLSQSVGFSSKASFHTRILDEVPLLERRALRAQQLNKQCPYPINSATATDSIAVIGGGIGAANLVLSLAERHKNVSVFCEDNALAQAASGNLQGAIYPLLTPDNNTLSQYFQQAYLFSLQRLISLSQQGHDIDFDLCGVLHTGHDERSRLRVQKIIHGYRWCHNIAQAVDAKQSSQIAGVEINEAGIYYPLGGWVAPQDLTVASFEQASQIANVSLQLNTQIIALEPSAAGWFLVTAKNRLGPFKTVAIANGKSLTRFEQTQHLAVTGFRGQVSHAPARAALSKLSTVLCAHGYMTPANNALHCLGASYVKDPSNLTYSPQEQVDNLHKIQHSYLDKAWHSNIDITQHSARVGVRMVTRDHAPMMGPVPNVPTMLAHYEQHQLTPESRLYWQNTPAPVHDGLYILGGLGSRGLSSGPLAAEALAAQICGDVIPLSSDFIALLSPNRMWMRKLLKGKPINLTNG
ncbi:FAD-dependent 5-carboxymethylaminomethyl-2-thiouridine(34) oxidoreductase MnmC [Shewanella youngdeokensis]|uniref:tRNA 5-methylaminomethyl-2-thiouridine biosynthesis bifunctional protein MnmC n=1 Tax=Shewanella youngdeokensis TaxID=2999068 RepID=A0ABZ0JUQ2_9GAMM|nr:FAD-dependent 5-carboxymethylaminomethyl-2-thiouridine(34) oxidoreductase MnmC [Shewanella sp. DAU334]